MALCCVHKINKTNYAREYMDNSGQYISYGTACNIASRIGAIMCTVKELCTKRERGHRKKGYENTCSAEKFTIETFDIIFEITIGRIFENMCRLRKMDSTCFP